MDNKLIVRMYNVGLGDCIHLQVPDKDHTYHILIDCGNKYGDVADLQKAISLLEEALDPIDPDQPDGKKWLDLLVVTHRHEDHIKGFDPEWFENIKIGRIWLSASIDLNHPQVEAKKSFRVQEFAMDTLTSLSALGLGGQLGDLVDDLLSLNNAGALQALRKTLPENSEIEPLYVHAGTPQEELIEFDDPAIMLHVLAPMKDIDHYYLGRIADDLLGFQEHSKEVKALAAKPADGAESAGHANQPKNISQSDFRNLRKNMHNTALSFVLKAGHLVNNTSTVLLLEWHGRRLLFSGDAQFKPSHKGQFRAGTSNGSWNVMWSIPEIQAKLGQPLDFIKVGHHGSHNATPWVKPEPGKKEHPINEIFNAMLPKPQENAKPKARAIVSTMRTSSYEKIPDKELMEEMGQRVANVNRYDEPAVKGYKIDAGVDQPLRTDQEKTKNGERVPYLEVVFEP